MKKKNLKATRGITLIALVVTIVVLLILAGVAIAMLTGENGIIAQAKLAAERTREEEAKEEQDLNKTAEDIPNWVNGGTGGDGSGGGTTQTTLEEAKEKTDPFNETTEVKDGDKSMTIPAGFKITEGDKIDEGIVVQDRDGNEFVWVPVAINDMVMCKTHSGSTITFNKETNTFTCTHGESETHTPSNQELVGKLYTTINGNTLTSNTTYNANSGYREPAVVTGNSSGDGTQCDGSDTNLNKVVEGEVKTSEKFLEQLQNEFYEMAKSVGKYGGFYIGRYETSGLKDNEIPKVKKGENPTVDTNWYTMYKNSKEIAKGALTEEEKTQGKTQSSVTSSMIWGCQWDQVMLWMKDEKNPTLTGGNKYYITDSSGMGWYSGVKGSDNNTNSDHKTGVDLKKDEQVLNRVKNIYDLAGNMREWSLEAYGINSRDNRGGAYGVSGSNWPASYRDSNSPADSIIDLSSRATLYVK